MMEQEKKPRGENEGPSISTNMINDEKEDQNEKLAEVENKCTELPEHNCNTQTDKSGNISMQDPNMVTSEEIQTINNKQDLSDNLNKNNYEHDTNLDEQNASSLNVQNMNDSNIVNIKSDSNGSDKSNNILINNIEKEEIVKSSDEDNKNSFIDTNTNKNENENMHNEGNDINLTSNQAEKNISGTTIDTNHIEVEKREDTNSIESGEHINDATYIEKKLQSEKCLANSNNNNESNAVENDCEDDKKLIDDAAEKNRRIIEMYEKKLETEINQKEKNKVGGPTESSDKFDGSISFISAKMRESISKIFREIPSSKPKIINEIKKNDNDENYENNKNESTSEKNETNPNNGNGNMGRDDRDNKASFSRSTLKEGSLLRLFRCEYFDTHLHIRYLYDRKEVGVHEYLVNSLYTQRNPEDILFYLPQLCQISLVRYESSSLYRFLLDKASKSMHFALKLNWIYNSIVEDNIPKYKEISQKMIQEIEMAVVNCKPLNSECKIFKEDKQTDLLILAYPLLFKRKFIIKKIRTNEKINQIKTFNKFLNNSYSLKGFSNPVEKANILSSSNNSDRIFKETCFCSSHIKNNDQQNTDIMDGEKVEAPQCDDKIDPQPMHSNDEHINEEAENNNYLDAEQKYNDGVCPKCAHIFEAKKEKKDKNKNKPLSPQMPSCYIINSGPLTAGSAKIRLPSTYAKLGDPLSFSKFSLPDCNYSFDMIEELQQFFMKQRRCDYFSLLNNFINLLITTSNLLANETDIDARNTLLNKFLYSLNTWMVMRRCIVASCENIFSMTGLCIPMESISASKSDRCGSRRKQKKNPKHLQILRFNNDECKIFFSKKRAPYLLVFEVADLDEDISHISDNTFYVSNRLFNIENDKNNNLFKTTQNNEKESGVKSCISDDEYPKNEKSDDELKHNSYILTKNYGGYNENGSSYECEMRPSYEEQNKKILINNNNKNIGRTSGSRYYESNENSYQYYDDKQYQEFYNYRDEQISKLNSNTNSADDEPSEVSSTNSSLNYFKDLNVIKMNDLYVYNAIVNDLRRENLISFTSEEEENIYLIKKCIGLAKEKSNDGYSDKEYDNNEMERRKSRKQNNNDNKNEINSASNESSAIGIKTDKFITTRSASMPNYLNNFKPADNNKNGENSDICEYNEASASSTDNQTAEQDENLKKTNQESEEAYDKNDKKETNLIKRVGNNNNGENNGKQASVLSSHPHNTRNCYYSVELPSVLPDISEYFKVENYLNEEFKKKNCKIIKTLLWGELFEDKKKKIRKISPYGKLKSWDLKCVIVKGGDDLRQELLASQLIKQFKIIFDNAGLPLWLRPYEILVTGSNSGIIEYVHDTCSVDSLKRKFGTDSISTIFNIVFADYIFEAKKNFIESHAAYSLISYLLQVKDRHNGNMLLDSYGHLIHIDYGFMLTNSPGNVNFETSPFKLTQEYLDIMDGENSDNYEYFRRLIVSGFLEARKHSEEIILLVELMMPALKMPCFSNGTQFCIDSLKERFMTNLTVDTCIQRINALIEASINNFRSVQYDYFQRITNGIM
ncbi:phosphatidylinositol 4-kinase, putative [Plasmodium vinckei petteri]|uniref:1-phosphatidylinositol 4-kinase n=2 Tax=Plasmodium vinckei petteri TaxID=138298 RepID=A0A6V7T4K3_PLAVN|nr:phosphatidylinositol 4-kinase, putative [Plasmodium vinckei petteri]